jgi:hypothetical protein
MIVMVPPRKKPRRRSCLKTSCATHHELTLGRATLDPDTGIVLRRICARHLTSSVGVLYAQV